WRLRRPNSRKGPGRACGDWLAWAGRVNREPTGLKQGNPWTSVRGGGQIHGKHQECTVSHVCDDVRPNITPAYVLERVPGFIRRNGQGLAVRPPCDAVHQVDGV